MKKIGFVNNLHTLFFILLYDNIYTSLVQHITKILITNIVTVMSIRNIALGNIKFNYCLLLI